MGVSPLDRRSEELNQGSSSPFHLADKIYGNEELLLTSEVPLPSFRASARSALAHERPSVQRLEANVMAGAATRAHSHTQ